MRFLIIQTAFLGDVVLATPLVEKLREYFPEDTIDFLVRKGNESLIQNNPKIDHILIWNKQEKKLRNLWRMIKEVRKRDYDYVINLQRFASSGFITMFSGAYTIGFDKNPLSRYFTVKMPHTIGTDPNHYEHEVQRNLSLIAKLTDNKTIRPKLYPTEEDQRKVEKYKQQPYVTMSPASVWFTKQLPAEKWVELIKETKSTVYLLGAKGDAALADEIKQQANRDNVYSLTGELSLLQSASLMADAQMNYVNDSAPMHLASAMNAPVTAIFCSTVPYFGFGPLSDQSRIIETKERLECRPCGLHGYKACPKGHFRCALSIEVEAIRG